VVQVAAVRGSVAHVPQQESVMVAFPNQGCQQAESSLCQKRDTRASLPPSSASPNVARQRGRRA